MLQLPLRFIRPAAALLLAAAFVTAGLWGWRQLQRGAAAPEVSYTLLDGSRHTLKALEGKVVLVNFWATSCASCVKEMPQLVATHRKFALRGFDTIAVAMRHDPPALVARFAESRALPFGVAIDNTGEIAQRFGDVQLTPTTFLIDQRGEIVRRYVGEPDFAALESLLDSMLPAPAAAS